MKVDYIIDKSAWSRFQVGGVAEVLEPLIRAGSVGIIAMSELEILFSAKSGRDYRETRADLEKSLTHLDTTEADFRRSLDIQQRLALKGHHRAASLPDLIIAAVAERLGLTVLHYDGDFDHIAGVSDLKATWILPRGSL